MRQAYRVVVYLWVCLLGGMAAGQTPHVSSHNLSFSEFKRSFREEKPSVVGNWKMDPLLYQAIQQRLGLPYRSSGVDDRGYDCSGFVWRVYKEAGIDLKRTSARTLWEQLPEAKEDEQGEFGTLVFFNDLSHVGIVRDPYSFYHVSSSQGVVRSFYSEYWGERIKGYRRVLLSPPPRKKVRPRY